MSLAMFLNAVNRQLIASTHGDHSVRITEAKNGKCLHVLTGHPRTPWTIAFHPSSNDLLATGCLGGQVRIWDLRVLHFVNDIFACFRYVTLLCSYCHSKSCCGLVAGFLNIEL